MHRPWNLEFHLWTTAENLTTEDVTGGKINGIKTIRRKGLHVREMECCVRVYIGARPSYLSFDDSEIQSSSSAIPASNRFLLCL
jgi:hypothetical protein